MKWKNEKKKKKKLYISKDKLVPNALKARTHNC